MYGKGLCGYFVLCHLKRTRVNQYHTEPVGIDIKFVLFSYYYIFFFVKEAVMSIELFIYDLLVLLKLLISVNMLYSISI